MKNSSSFSFPPARFFGLFFLIIFLFVIGMIEAVLGILISRTSIGLVFFIILISICLLAVIFIFLSYRLYSLIFSSYDLERDGLHIHWGLRHEIIPLNAIEWIRHPSEMPFEVPWSVLPMPGAYLGTVEDQNYGQFEFLASNTSKMLFLGTSHCVYAISPNKPDLFIDGFDRILQMGTLTKIEWTSVRPASYLLDAWHNKTGRLTTIISIDILTALFLWVGFRFPLYSTISLQFSSSGKAEEILPVMNILVIPILAVCCWLLLTFIGIELYRKKQTQKTAELVWCSDVVVQLQFLLAAIFIL